MQCYVINLDRDVERRAWIEAQLAAAKIPHERISAVLGAALSDETLAAHRKAGSVELSTGEIGCLLSHARALRTFLETSDEYAIILEDDVHISERISHIIENLTPAFDQFEIVKLESTPMTTVITRSHIKAGGRSIYTLKGFNLGTAAYAVSRRTAEILANALEHSHVPCDYLIFSPQHNGMRIGQMHPAPFIQDGFLPGAQLKSSIGARPSHRRTKKKLIARLRFIRDYLYNCVFMFRDLKRVKIPFG